MRTARDGIVWLVMAAFCLCGWGHAAAVFAQRKHAPIEVAVDDIGEAAVLIGRLKKPLGTAMTIVGRWSLPTGPVKDNSPRFTVSRVNGTELASPVEFNFSQLNVDLRGGETAMPKPEDRRSLDGVSWTLRAYETGRFEGSPVDWWKETGIGPSATPYWFRTFTSELEGVLLQDGPQISRPSK